MTIIAGKVLCISAIVGLLSGCSPSEQGQTGDGLRSDMPLRDVAFYAHNENERREMQAVCEQWKASQRSPASWPSIVVSTCNNVDSANQLIQSEKDRAEFKKGMGI